MNPVLMRILQGAGVAAFNAIGGDITWQNGKKIHTFRNSASMNVFAGNSPVNVAMVGGGGGGGAGGGAGAGGGGAGEIKILDNQAVSMGNYMVVVGLGGTGGVISSTTSGLNGGSSAIPLNSGDIRATGGYVDFFEDYVIHTFVGSGTFEILSGSGNVEYLIVAGGGGGGGGSLGNLAGGGGGVERCGLPACGADGDGVDPVLQGFSYFSGGFGGVEVDCVEGVGSSVSAYGAEAYAVELLDAVVEFLD